MNIQQEVVRLLIYYKFNTNKKSKPIKNLKDVTAIIKIYKLLSSEISASVILRASYWVVFLQYNETISNQRSVCTKSTSYTEPQIGMPSLIWCKRVNTLTGPWNFDIKKYLATLILLKSSEKHSN